jgi:SAM-dependent methyltransferase
VIFLSALRVGVFAAIGREARRADDLAEDLDLDERALETVLLALAAIEVLVREEDGRFRIAPDFAPYLLPDGEKTQANIFAHHYHLMRRWVRLVEVLRTGHPVPRDPEGRTPRQLRDFIYGMADISRSSSVEVAEKVDLSGRRRLLDLGGGPGTAAITFAAKWPQLTCVVFDLPDVIEIAREQIARAGLGERVTVLVGDYHTDGLGEGYDVVYASNIIHSLGPANVRMLCAKAHRALEPGGLFVLKDFFLDNTRTRPVHSARFSVNMLVGTEEGRAYALGETRKILARVGFGEVEVIPVAAHSMMLLATKP